MSDDNSEQGAFYYSVMDNEFVYCQSEFVYCRRTTPFLNEVCLYRVNEKDPEKSSFFVSKKTFTERYKKVAFLT